MAEAGTDAGKGPEKPFFQEPGTEEQPMNRAEALAMAALAGRAGSWEYRADLNSLFLDKAMRDLLAEAGFDPPGTLDAWLEILHPEDRRHARELIQEAVTSKAEGMAFEFRLVNKEGLVTWWQLNCGAVRDAEGRLERVLGAAEDITGRKRMEDALRQSEFRFRTLFEFMNDGVSIFEAVNGGEDFVFIEFNAAAERIDRIKREEVLSRSIKEVYPGIERFGLLEIMRRVLRTGKPEFMPAGRYTDERLSVWRETNVYKLPTGEVVTVFSDVTERKLAEDALRESREQYRTLVANMNDGLVVTDAFGHISYINDNVCGMIGLSRMEVMGRPITEFLVESDRSAVLKRMEKADTDSGERFELQFLHVEGRVITALVSPQPVKDTAGQYRGSVCVVTDITDRKQAELALKERTRILNKRVKELDCLYETSRLMHRSDVDLEATLRGVVAVLPTAYRRPATTSARVVLGETVIASPGCVETGNRLSAPINVEGRKVGLLEVYAGIGTSGEEPFEPEETALLHNVADRLGQMLESMRVDEERIRLATAVEQTEEGVCITDRDGYIQYVNKAFERISGYSLAEVKGESTRILKSGKHDKPFYQLLWKTIKGGRTWTGHFINRRKDGGTYEAECTISPIVNRAGKITNYVSVMRDVTEKLKLENQLRQAQKMEAIGTLAGGIAHDFNNILAAVMGFAETALLMTSEENELVRESLEDIVKGSRRGAELVKHILTFSRRSEKDKHGLDPSPVLKEAMKLLRASLPSTITFKESFAGDGLMVMADPSQLHQLVMNLCTNAAHAMARSGGELAVRLEKVEVSAGQAKMLGLVMGEHLMLTVRDTGHGMDKSVMERMFDPFFTTKRPGEGTGLGLSTVHGIVESHGGAIDIDSIPGKGTTVRVYFPVAPSEVDDAAVEGFSLTSGVGRVLLVDDEEAVVRSIGRMLTALGYTVVTESDSRVALERFLEDPDQYDLLFTDQTMPHLTGLDLAKEVLAVKPDLPVVLCTGYSELVTPEIARDAGIRELAQKPLDLNALGALTARILNSGQDKD